MKKIFIVFCLIIFAVIGWLIFRQPKTMQRPVVLPPTPIQMTNVQTQQSPAATVSTSNEFARPDSIDEETWNKWMSYRQMVLSANQPVEFYARVLDQNEQPVEGAKLKLKISRMDETMFTPTNYLHWDPALAVQEKDFYLLSDANGWIQFTGTNGSFLNIWGLTKEGYLSSYPDGNFAGVHYELRGVRTPTQDILMTNAWNPQKGYILHLRKIDAK